MSDPYDLSQASSSKPAEAPRIIVDSDWKAQAQAEKEKLAAAEEKRAASPDADPYGRMPPADFKTIVASFATQALLYLGAIPDPETGRGIVSIEYAKHYIDLLDILEQKSKGNLDAEEASELSGVLSELRSRFVYVSKAVSQAMAQQAAGGAPGAPGAPGARPAAAPPPPR